MNEQNNAVEVENKPKPKPKAKTAKATPQAENTPKAKTAKATPQAALDNARLELATVYARVKILRADYKAAVKNGVDQSTLNDKRVVYKEAQAQLARKLNSRYIKARGLNKYLAENSFQTKSANVLTIAAKLADSATLANGNIKESNKHIGAGFFDALSCVNSILGRVNVAPLSPWADWLSSYDLETNEFLTTCDFRDLVSFLISDKAPKLVGCLEYIRRLDKSNESDDTALHANLLKIATEYLLPKCFIGDARNALHVMLTRLSVEDIKRGEVIKPLIIDGVSTPRQTLQTKSELKAAAARIQEREAALADNIVSSCPFDPRVGIFAGINALTKALELGLKTADNKAKFTVEFFLTNNRMFLQAALDSAACEAIKGAGKADNSHLSALNSIVSAYSIEITPNNAQQTSEYILGGGDIVRYVLFICPWLGYKKDDGGFYEKARSASPKTSHIGAARPIWRGGVEGDVVQYPCITVVDYLRLLKTVSKETKVKNRSIKKANARIEASKV